MCKLQTPRSSLIIWPCPSHQTWLPCAHQRPALVLLPLLSDTCSTLPPHVCSSLLFLPSEGWGKWYLQCTVMGWFPDCCCCFCTAAMMLIMPFPSLGMPTSGQPWKWNCRICRLLFSFGERGGQRSRGTLVFPGGEAPPALLPWYWWPGGLSQCSSHIPLPSSAPLWCLHRTLVHLRASTGHTSPGINGTVEGAQNTMYGRSGAAPWATCPPLDTIPVTQNTLSPRCWKFSGSFLT